MSLHFAVILLNAQNTDWLVDPLLKNKPIFRKLLQFSSTAALLSDSRPLGFLQKALSLSYIWCRGRRLLHLFVARPAGFRTSELLAVINFECIYPSNPTNQDSISYLVDALLPLMPVELMIDFVRG